MTSIDAHYALSLEHRRAFIAQRREGKLPKDILVEDTETDLSARVKKLRSSLLKTANEDAKTIDALIEEIVKASKDDLSLMGAQIINLEECLKTLEEDTAELSEGTEKKEAYLTAKINKQKEALRKLELIRNSLSKISKEGLF